MMDEDMEQLDLSLPVTTHYVSLLLLALLSLAHTFRSNAQLMLTTQQENLGAQRLHSCYIAFIPSYKQPPFQYLLCMCWHHVGNYHTARLMSIYPHFEDEKIETVRVCVTYLGSEHQSSSFQRQLYTLIKSAYLSVQPTPRSPISWTLCCFLCLAFPPSTRLIWCSVAARQREKNGVLQESCQAM